MKVSLPFSFGTLTLAALVTLWVGLPPTSALLSLLSPGSPRENAPEPDSRGHLLSPEEMALTARVVWESTEKSTLTPDDPPEELPEIFSERDPRPVWVTVVTEGTHTTFGREMNLYRSLRLATSRVMKVAGKAPIRCIRVEIATHLSRVEYNFEQVMPEQWTPGQDGVGREDDDALSWIRPLHLLDELHPVTGLTPDHMIDTLRQIWKGQVKVNTSPLVGFDSQSFVTRAAGDQPLSLYRGRPEIPHQQRDQLHTQITHLISRLASAGVVAATSPSLPLDESILYPRIPPPAPDYVGTFPLGPLPPTTRAVAQGLRYLVETAPRLRGPAIKKRITSMEWMATWLVTHQRGMACDGQDQPGIMDRGLLDWSPDPLADSETLAALQSLSQLGAENPAFGAFSNPSD